MFLVRIVHKMNATAREETFNHSVKSLDASVKIKKILNAKIN